MTAAQLSALAAGGDPNRKPSPGRESGDIAALVALSKMPLVG